MNNSKIKNACNVKILKNCCLTLIYITEKHSYKNVFFLSIIFAVLLEKIPIL